MIVVRRVDYLSIERNGCKLIAYAVVVEKTRNVSFAAFRKNRSVSNMIKNGANSSASLQFTFILN